MSELANRLSEVVELGASAAEIDQVAAAALDALGRLVPYDLATVMELSGQTLAVRIARGRLDSAEVRNHSLELEEFPSIREVLASGKPRAFTEHDHSAAGDPFDGVLNLEAGHACMVAPLRAHGQTFGLLSLDREICREYAPESVELVDVFSQLLGLAMTYGQQSVHLWRLQRQLAEQNRVLNEERRGPMGAEELLDVLPSPTMKHVVELAKQVAGASVPVLVTGETGVGKEVLAHAIHSWSDRDTKPFVAVNCAALPPSLIESELFGHVKGAFTGALVPRLGRFQAADGGVLFLDEVGELPLDMQAKLLRVLQNGAFEPVGSDRSVTVDVRIIAATNRPLEEQVRDGAFREDLYYRLAVFPIAIPPLRARSEDIPTIAANALRMIGKRSGRGPWHLNDADLERMRQYSWPGNIRELVNALERSTIVSNGGALNINVGARRPGSPAHPAAPSQANILPLVEVERAHIERALRETGGRVHGSGGAAELLGLNPSTLRSRMSKLGIRRVS